MNWIDFSTILKSSEESPMGTEAEPRVQARRFDLYAILYKIHSFNCSTNIGWNRVNTYFFLNGQTSLYFYFGFFQIQFYR